MAYYLQSVGSTIKNVIVNDDPRRWLKKKKGLHNTVNVKFSFYNSMLFTGKNNKI